MNSTFEDKLKEHNKIIEDLKNSINEKDSQLNK